MVVLLSSIIKHLIITLSESSDWILLSPENIISDLYDSIYDVLTIIGEDNFDKMLEIIREEDLKFPKGYISARSKWNNREF